jgi:hypothetical protein
MESYSLNKKDMTDKIVESVIEELRSRSEVGFKKYGTNLERTDLTTIEWLDHARQEALDLALYLQRIKEDLQNKKHENTKGYIARI